MKLPLLGLSFQVDLRILLWASLYIIFLIIFFYFSVSLQKFRFAGSLSVCRGSSSFGLGSSSFNLPSVLGPVSSVWGPAPRLVTPVHLGRVSSAPRRTVKKKLTLLADKPGLNWHNEQKCNFISSCIRIQFFSW